MWKGIATFGVTMLAFLGVAAAAGPTVTVAVKPDTPSSHSTLNVSAKGPFTESGLPTSLKLTAQKGFKSSAKSVSVLCKTSKVGSSQSSPCPAKSKIGSGAAIGTVTSPALGKQKVPLTLYLGKPQHTGDIASIVLAATVPILGPDNVKGRLFKTSSGSTEILFPHLISAPSGITIKLNRLSFSAHAVQGTHSLITNPSSCRGGHWTGTFTLGFSSGSVSKNTSIPCSK